MRGTASRKLPTTESSTEKYTTYEYRAVSIPQVTSDVCSIPPPYLGGSGSCDAECDMVKVLQAGAEAAIAAIPGVGDFFSALVGLFWPGSPDDEAQILQNTINYILAKTNEEMNSKFVDFVNSNYNGLVQTAQELAASIQAGGTSDYRTGLLTDLTGQCNGLRSDINGFLQESEGPAPQSLVPLIGNIGQSCIAVRLSAAFHYAHTTNSNTTQAQIDVFRNQLDWDIGNYTQMMNTAVDRAQSQRLGNITSIVNGDNYGYCQHDDWDWDHKNVAMLIDNACAAVGGSPSNGQDQISSVPHTVLNGYQCHSMFDQNNLNEFSDLVSLYKLYMINAYTDNFLSASRELLPLWQLQTSENIIANNKGTLYVRLASSLFHNGDYQGNWDDQTPLEISPSLTEVENMYTYFDSPQGGSVNDRITQIVLGYGGYDSSSVHGYQITANINGQDQTYSFGCYESSSSCGSFPQQTLNLNDNQRITALGLQYCSESVQSCPSNGMAFQISTVTSTGALDTSVPVTTWNPFGYPNGASSTEWVEAPPLALTNEDQFVPHLLSFISFGSSEGWVRLPVWSYGLIE